VIFFYNLAVCIGSFALKIFALFHRKVKLFVLGRNQTFQKLSILKKEDRTVWFHMASLGEFEQARPIITAVKKNHKNHKIVISFFSPSGYEIVKNSRVADIVCYLPLDTRRNASQFVRKVNPEIAIIVKNELWPNLLNQLKKQSIPTILVSGIFKKNQLFFKSYGKWMRNSLKAFQHFFVQDPSSVQLLKSINLNAISISGDTRFDRVMAISEQDNSLPEVTAFKAGQYTVVAGSTWKEGEQLFVDYINRSEKGKFIIVPHAINPTSIQRLKTAIRKKTVLYTEKEGKILSEFTVLIVDTVGLLSKIYAHADVAYVGGGFKSGLHNILEPAAFGIPVVIGPRYKKFNEAVDLVGLKGCIPINNQSIFCSIFDKLKSNQLLREAMGEINQAYVRRKTGAMKPIVKYIYERLSV